MDPIYLFVSKCHCLLELDQSTRQDRKHVEMLALILLELFLELIADTQGGEITERQLIKEAKLLLKVCKTFQVRRVLKDIGMEPIQLLPVDAFLATELEIVRRFAQSSLCGDGSPN